ncbi:hypothetical protein [Modestobacter sp. SYSU DS0657]
MADVPRAVARLSMELPYSVPRLAVGLVFAVAAVVAVLGAGRFPGRRTWWTAVAFTAAGIAAVKAGSTVHKSFLESVGAYDDALRALVVSAPMAVAVVGWLWWLSRRERRDRRRVLGSLAAFAFASVGLSAVSSAVEQVLGRGSVLAATATFVEESCEGLAAVAFLVAVLVGVVPHLVLPAGWHLRRADDARPLPALEPTRRTRPWAGG